MCVEGVSFEQMDGVDDFSAVREERVLWNYHEIRKLDEIGQTAILHVLSAKKETHRKLSHWKDSIKPMMSGGGRVSGGASYSEKEGFKGEVKVEFEFGPKDKPDKSEDKDNSSDNSSGNTSAGDIDNSDRGSDNDKD